MLHVSRPAERFVEPVSRSLRDAPAELEILPALKRYWALIAIFAAVAFVMAVAVVRTIEPSYTATAHVLYDPSRGEAARRTSERDQIQYIIDSAQLETQMQLLKSEQISRPVINAFDLANDENFTRQKFSFRQMLRGLFGYREPSPPPSTFAAIAARFDSQLDVRRIGQSSVLQVSVQANDGEKAARLTNAIVASYIARQIAIRSDGARRNSQFERPIRELSSDSDLANEAIRTGVIEVDKFPSADARVINAAHPPTGPSAPRTALIVAFGICLGAALGSVVALMRFATDRPVLTGDHLENEIDVPFLGTVGRLKLRDPSSKSLQAYSRVRAANLRMIRTAVEANIAERGGHIIGVVSSEKGVGKSTVARGLGAAFAAAGRRTLLIDANPHNPTLSRDAVHGGNEMIAGLPQILDGLDVDKAGIPTGIPNLWVMALPQDTRRSHFVDRLDAPSARAAARHLHDEYDRIIIDLPASNDHPEAWAMAPMLDSYVLVARHGRTRRTDAARLVATLREAKVPVFGAILTHAKG